MCARSGRQNAGYTTEPFTRLRRAALDLAVSERKHVIHALLEVEVTRPRQLLREHEARTGEALSFTGFVIGCVARAVDEQKSVQGYRQGRGRLVLFDDVDVTMLMERTVDGQRRPLFHIIRAANRKSLRELHQEIRAAQAQPAVTPGGRWGLRAYELVPGFARRAAIRFAHAHPRLWKRFGGTVAVTSVGMFGRARGWGIPVISNTLDVTVGGITSKPESAESERGREWLCLTISVDHDIVDGAPLARFAIRLKTLIESAYGMEDLAPRGETATAQAPEKAGTAP